MQGCAPGGQAPPQVAAGAQVLSRSVLGRKGPFGVCKGGRFPLPAPRELACVLCRSALGMIFTLKIDHQARGCPLGGWWGSQAPPQLSGIYWGAPSSPHHRAPHPSPSLLIQSLPSEMEPGGTPPSQTHPGIEGGSQRRCLTPPVPPAEKHNRYPRGAPPSARTLLPVWLMSSGRRAGSGLGSAGGRSRWGLLPALTPTLLIARTLEPPFGRNAASLNFIFFFNDYYFGVCLIY